MMVSWLLIKNIILTSKPKLLKRQTFSHSARVDLQNCRIGKKKFIRAFPRKMDWNMLQQKI